MKIKIKPCKLVANLALIITVTTTKITHHVKCVLILRCSVQHTSCVMLITHFCAFPVFSHRQGAGTAIMAKHNTETNFMADVRHTQAPPKIQNWAHSRLENKQTGKNV